MACWPLPAVPLARNLLRWVPDDVCLLKALAPRLRLLLFALVDSARPWLVCAAAFTAAGSPAVPWAAGLLSAPACLVDDRQGEAGSRAC